MKYLDFYNKFKDFPIIRVSDIKNIEPDFNLRRLYEWQKKGYIKKAASNFYFFADKVLSDRQVNFIANKLYEPSYLSLEYALNYYSLIPEIVFWRTSVSSKRTKNIISSLGNFSYCQVKKEFFFGYKLINADNATFKIAEPEKALLDFLYLRDDVKTENDFYELRINKKVYKEIIDQEKINNYLKVFDLESLRKKIGTLNKILNKKYD